MGTPSSSPDARTCAPGSAGPCFRPCGRPPRLLAGAAALALTASLLLPFLRQPDAVVLAREPATAWLSLLTETPPEGRAALGTARLPKPVAMQPPARPATRPVPEGILFKADPTPTAAVAAAEPQAPASAPEHAALPQDSAQAPLRLDASVLRQASRASKGTARQMADGSGAYFGDEHASTQASLAKAAAAAGKPACVRDGGSLLSPLRMAYEMLLEKCTNR